jgi:tetratricopeptide (TPR) repeat protein
MSVRLRALIMLLLLAVTGLGLTVAGIYLWAGWHERKARQQLARYDFEAAYRHYQQCLKVWSGSAALHLEAGRAARRARNFDAAEEHLRLSQKLKGTSADLQLERLLLEAQNGDLTQVEKTLKEYVRLDKPETPLVLEALADAYVRTGRPFDAEEVVVKLLKREPNHVEVLCHQGRLLALRQDRAEAQRIFERILELRPSHLGARYELSKLLLDEEPATALEHVRYLREHGQDSLELQLRQATCHKYLGEGDKAKRLLDDLLDEAPDNITVLVARGVLAIELADPTGAETWLRKVLILDPFHHEANYQLCQALVQQGNRLDAAREQLAVCARINADLNRIKEIQRTSRDKLGQSPALLHECGVLLLRNGRTAEGIEWLYRVLQVETTHQQTHRVLFEYFEKTGDKERAAEHRRFLSSEK